MMWLGIDCPKDLQCHPYFRLKRLGTSRLSSNKDSSGTDLLFTDPPVLLEAQKT